MEDEQEIHRYVTIASAPPPPQNILTLALPIQHPGAAAGGGAGREDCWSEGATAILIEAWGERYLELSRGNMKQQQWKEVAEIVSRRDDYSKPSKTDVQCKNRIDTLKKKYKIEKAKIASGQGASKWVFFRRLDQLIGQPTGAPTGTPTGTATIPVVIPFGGRTLYQQRQEGKMDSESSSDTTDSYPPETRKRPRVGRKLRRGKGWGDSMRELSRAILEFGEAYERTESSKLQQVLEMEKQRMGFAKELEMQRMQFFIKTQSEITQVKNGRNNVGSSNYHRSNN